MAKHGLSGTTGAWNGHEGDVSPKANGVLVTPVRCCSRILRSIEGALDSGFPRMGCVLMLILLGYVEPLFQFVKDGWTVRWRCSRR